MVGLPPVPREDGPLAIRVVHPSPEMTRPAVASTFIYGSVGTGRATLTINGRRVEVYPNGAFLGYLPVPANGRWELVADGDGQVQIATVSYRVPRTPAPGAPRPAAVRTESFATPRVATVTGGADTLATGSDVAIGRSSPTGPYTWFLPRGARLVLTGQRGDQLRARLAPGVDAWFPATSVSLGSEYQPGVRPVDGLTLDDAAEWTDLRIRADAAPFQVRSDAGELLLLIYDRTPPHPGPGPYPTPELADTDFIGGFSWETAPEGARLVVRLQQRLWGMKSFYEGDGTLVLRLRKPPIIHRDRPLRGIRVVVDPGHPPGGATGPTGLTEAEANLNIAVPLAELLRQRGAEVLITRTTNTAVSLTERVELATRSDAHILVSVHNNAFPEGVDPFARHGTSTYYFHGHSAPLARWLQREIQGVTRIRDLGTIAGNLALVRPTWMPAVLTESLFMPLPDQEASLRNPDFTYALALAHVRALERFLLEP
jgi:N-acetylmuramoyl-L-alanine amidase